MTRWFNTPLELHRRWVENKKPLKSQDYVIGGRYKILHEIGKGASGIVHLAVDMKTNKNFAIKELNKAQLEKQYYSELLRQSGPANRKTKLTFSSNNSSRDESPMLLGVNQSKKRRLNNYNTVQVPLLYRMLEEIEILNQLPQHQNIIKLIKVIEDSDYEDLIFIVTELAERGTILDIVPHSISKHYSDNQCRNLFKQLVEAIDHLHQNNVIHRDIKPQNILLSHDNTIKLIDFGNATKISNILDRTCNTNISSPAFTAPELLRKATKNQSNSPTSVDIWSMGITLYCIAYGKLPFENSSLLELYNDIQNNAVVHSDKIDPELCDLIDRLLEKNPKNRITIKELKVHPWMLK